MNTVARKRQLKEQEIHDTAARLFAERGYHATRIDKSQTLLYSFALPNGRASPAPLITIERE